MRKPIIALSVLIIAVGVILFNYSSSKNPPATDLLLRVDDIGMNHSVNMAFAQLAETGMPISASVMFACPWYQEAVDLIKKYPNVSVGVHLTLNSEWKYYRWGPVLGKTAVPSIVDSTGYFYPSTKEFLAQNLVLEEVEKELAAQIERALASGLKIDYVDYHMRTAIATPELRAIVEKLAAKYNLGISMYFGEKPKTMFDVPVENKKEVFFKHLDSLQVGKTNVVVLHIAQAHPEMNVLVDMNNNIMNTAEGLPTVSKHRQAELDMICSEDFKKLADSKKFRLVNYSDLIKSKGLKSMKKPV